jgi:hypothetical protein
MDTLATRVTELILTTTTPSGRVSETISVDVVLRAPEAAIVSLSSVADGTSQVRLPSAWEIVRATTPPVDLGKGQIAIPSGATLALRTPTVLNGRTRTNVVVRSAPDRVVFPSEEIVTFTVTGDSSVEAFYRR